MADVVQNSDKQRFEILIGGSVVGCTMYQIVGNDIIFTHTVIEADRQEHGLGGQLVQAALDQVRADTTYRVVAQCPFVAHWMGEHPDYQELLTR